MFRVTGWGVTVRGRDGGQGCTIGKGEEEWRGRESREETWKGRGVGERRRGMGKERKGSVG